MLYFFKKENGMKRDVKGYVEMIKREKEAMKTLTKTSVEVSEYKESENMMVDFVKNTLSNKFQVKGNCFVVKGNSVAMMCKLKHSGVMGEGIVKYTFAESSCSYTDWLGYEIDYSKAWVDFKAKRADKEESVEEIAQ